MLAFMFYDVVLAVHILAVVIAFGVVFAYPLIDAQAKRAGPAALPGLHQLHLVLATRLIQPAMTIVLVAGIYLALDRFSLGDPWISATFAILIVLFGLTGAVLIPADRRLAELAARDLQDGGGEPSAEYLAASRRADIFGSVALVLVIVAVFLMTTKPGA